MQFNTGNSFLNFLATINDHYGNLILATIAVASLFYAYFEYVLKRRPFVMPEIASDIKKDGWYFAAILVNKGTLPGIVRINKAFLKIGDEEYPTNFHQDLVLAANEKQKYAPIGYINQNGLKKIRGHEYSINRVEIFLEINSKAIGQKRFKYTTTVRYEVNVLGDTPEFIIVSEILK